MSDSLRPLRLQPTSLLCPWQYSRQKYWSGLPCPSPGELRNPGIEPGSPALPTDSLPAELPGKPQKLLYSLQINQSYSKELMQFSKCSSIILLFQMKSVVELVNRTSHSKSLRLKWYLVWSPPLLFLPLSPLQAYIPHSSFRNKEAASQPFRFTRK